MTAAFVHVGYALMLAALVARDILWLRGLLACAQSLIGFYAWRMGVPAIAAWNLLFVGVNATWVARILHERRAVSLPADLRALYERHFAALTPPEFLRWWRQGRRTRLRGVRLARDGEVPDALYFVMEGVVRITRRGEAVAELPAGYFVAEMSLITGQPANADADAVGEVDVVQWPLDELSSLRARNPVLWTKIQSVIGHDLVNKINRKEPVSAL
ncbi:MAG: cyclic nucleotide-binding domain-containing protein [Acidobacteria bacterium]|nr:cyclic nucleotide-binding domain-containing protein [Acidobacteriota bacterium]